MELELLFSRSVVNFNAYNEDPYSSFSLCGLSHVVMLVRLHIFNIDQHLCALDHWISSFFATHTMPLLCVKPAVYFCTLVVVADYFARSISLSSGACIVGTSEEREVLALFL